MSETPLDWEDLKRRKAEVPGHVVYRVLVSETVLLNIETGLYHGMDEIGSRFFQALRESESVESAVAELSEEFDAPVEQLRTDMMEFCQSLLGRGLIQLGKQARGKR